MSRFHLPIWSPRLLWKLAGSYMLITIVVAILYTVIDVELEYRALQTGLTAQMIAVRAQQEASRFAPLLNGDTPNLPALEHLLFRLQHELEDRHTGIEKDRYFYFALADFKPAALTLAVLNRQGQAIVHTGAPPNETNHALLAAACATPILTTQQAVVLHDTAAIRQVVVPLPDQNNLCQNVFLVQLQLPRYWWQGVWLHNIFGELRTADLLSIAVLSLTFGYIIARNLTKRLERISTAAEAWGRGDFTAVAQDKSADEIGELSRRMNRMAEELREVVALRQSLATAEERNRLARDLHDTVKQRAFALSMQIAATQALLETAPNVAQTRLTEAEKLAHQIQQELVTIIDELRPEATRQPRQSFLVTLQETLNDWSRQNGIAIKTTVEEIPRLPPHTQSELLRIAQEACANIARHSRAKNVAVELLRSNHNGTIALTVRDDGRGFDPTQQNGGMGLRNMRERAEALPAGSFTLRSQHGQGTHIEVRCALQPITEA